MPSQFFTAATLAGSVDAVLMMWPRKVAQVTHPGVELQTGPADGSEHLPEVRQCGPKAVRMHQEVVKVDDTVALGVICQHPLHELLKRLKGITVLHPNATVCSL